MTHNNLDRVPYTRKPSSWDEIQATVPEGTDLAGLTERTTAELGIEHPLSDFSSDVPQYFILKNSTTGRRYLVDTQGYSYVRYAAEIRDAKEQG